MDLINKIAKIITEDPDILNELAFNDMETDRKRGLDLDEINDEIEKDEDPEKEAMRKEIAALRKQKEYMLANNRLSKLTDVVDQHSQASGDETRKAIIELTEQQLAETYRDYQENYDKWPPKAKMIWDLLMKVLIIAKT